MELERQKPIHLAPPRPRWRPLLGLLGALALITSSYTSAADLAPRYQFGEILELTREVMTRNPARTLLNALFAEELKINPELAKKYGFEGTKLKGFTETQMILLLQEAPSLRDEIRAYLKAVPKDAEDRVQTPELKALRKKWKTKFTELFEDKALFERFLQKNNPLEPILLAPPPGTKGFGKIKTFITHAVTLNGVLRPADDVEKAVVDFIDGAKKELRFNVFDFDLESVADALIRAHKRGVDVMGGIDKGVIETRPEVKAIFDRLVAAGIPMQAVDSVGLNHQKLITRDHSIPSDAATLLSEGNFTKSCLSKTGDTSGTTYHSAKSIPNANMVNIIEGDTLALVVHHEITKTIDPRFALRGRAYPISGAYKIMGAKAANGDERFLIIAFTPNGGLGDINQNFIGRAIRSTPGPHRFAQFAWSSDKTEAALLEEAVASKKAGKAFSLKAVGDTPFAMQKWSVFLSIAGYRLEGEGEAKRYVKIRDSENKWLQALGPEDYEKLVQNIRVAPRVYGNHTIDTADGAFKLTAKIHHKLYVVGLPGKQVGIFGSFNFSQGAENNQEYIVAIVDDELNSIMSSIVDSLAEESPRSVAEETVRRNSFRDFDADQGPSVDAAKAGRSTDDVKVNCKKLLKPTVGLTPKG